MNKNGAVALTVRILIGLVASVAIIFFIYPLFNTALAVFFQDVSELTESSISELESEINRLSSGENTTMLFYSTNGFVLVAFDKSKLSGSGTLDYYERPVECYDKSCLVVCKDTDSKNSCKNSEMVKVFDFDNFDVENTDTGIIPLIEKGYTEIVIEKSPGTVKITRV